jgi:hypothetical protein
MRHSLAPPRALLTPLAALVLGCCGCQPRIAPTAASLALAAPAVRAPQVAAVPAPSDDETTKIRQAVRDFMKETRPGSQVEGVWLLMFRNNYCIAGADTTLGSQRRTIDLLVRLYARDNGSVYWRAESLDGSAAALLIHPSSKENQPAE